MHRNYSVPGVWSLHANNLLNFPNPLSSDFQMRGGFLRLWTGRAMQHGLFTAFISTSWFIASPAEPFLLAAGGHSLEVQKFELRNYSSMPGCRCERASFFPLLFPQLDKCTKLFSFFVSPWLVQNSEVYIFWFSD
jgi:hypothetical protein